MSPFKGNKHILAFQLISVWLMAQRAKNFRKVELSWEFEESGAAFVKRDGQKNQSLNCVESLVKGRDIKNQISF